jgi:hypothetical protein
LGSSRLAGGCGILASSLIVSLDPSEALGLLLRLLNHPLAHCHMGLSGGFGLGGRCSETVPQLLDSTVTALKLPGQLLNVAIKPLLVCRMGLCRGLCRCRQPGHSLVQLLDSFVAVGQLGCLFFLLSLAQLQPLLRPISFGTQPIRVTAQGIFYLLRGGR